MLLVLEDGNRFLNLDHVSHAFVFGQGEHLTVAVSLVGGSKEEFWGEGAAKVLRALKLKAI